MSAVDPAHLDLTPLIQAYRAAGVSVTRPLSAEAQERLSRRLGLPLPRELAALAAETSGLRGWGVDLTLDGSRDGAIIERPFLGRCLCIQNDGFGNRHLLQPRKRRATIWWLSRNPTTLVLCARSLVDFLTARLPYVEAMTRHEERGGEAGFLPAPELEAQLLVPLSRPQALERVVGDDEARRFVEELPDGSSIYDFGHASPGSAADLSGRELSAARARGYGDLLALVPARPSGLRRAWWRRLGRG